VASSPIGADKLFHQFWWLHFCWLWRNLDGGVASLPIRVGTAPSILSMGAAPFLLGVAEFTRWHGFIVIWRMRAASPGAWRHYFSGVVERLHRFRVLEGAWISLAAATEFLAFTVFSRAMKDRWSSDLPGCRQGDPHITLFPADDKRPTELRSPWLLPGRSSQSTFPPSGDKRPTELGGGGFWR